eukprot:CAMPEP_0197243330 /NCGR_PEP_ID=MMETSP1429-20130617/8819_1 /TAXON_ID=49237 /ORGANISM="Chaetoceros  sp., Strain UNC1202" /LENGTH=229 /DNA_ID=CAMNT_0042703539 /DNA_START=503 /DNA_END=1194 /DNA_ORIENTATION=+
MASGQRLSGSTTLSPSVALSPKELRERRLASLGKIERNTNTATATAIMKVGQARSNTLDNTLTLGGGVLKCHGIQSPSSIRFLSQLEALRYYSVGGYFKSPKNPIRVCGSTSHFTVLFGPKESLIESKSDLLLARCRRSFKSVVQISNEGGEFYYDCNDDSEDDDIDSMESSFSSDALSMLRGGNTPRIGMTVALSPIFTGHESGAMPKPSRHCDAEDLEMLKKYVALN